MDFDRKPPSPLMSAYIERREDLRRFFMARTGSREDGEDLIQDLYVKVQGLAPETLASPGAYLYRLAQNMMVDRLRQRRRATLRDGAWRQVHHVSAANEDVADAPSAEAAVVARQRLDRILKALDELPERTRKIFSLHKFDGLSHPEVAARLGISRSSVEKHMIDALRHLSERSLR